MPVDPAGLAVVVHPDGTADLTWTPSTTPGVVDYSLFRRSPSTGAVFVPGVDTPHATGIVVASYADSGLSPGRYDWQVFGRSNVIASDSFNRANSAVTMGSTDSAYGGTAKLWTPLSGSGWGINANQAYMVSPGGFNMTAIDAGVADCTIEVTIANADGGSASPIWRVTDDTHFYVCNSNQAFEAAAFTPKGPAFSVALGRGYTDGDVMRIVLSGNTHSVYIQAAGAGPFILVSSFTDAFSNTATKVGLWESGGSTGRFDTFKVTA